LTQRCTAVAGAALALVLTASASAQAATAGVDVVKTGTTATTLLLVYQADPGETNAVNVGFEPDGWYRVHDPGAVITPGTRCESAGGGDVRCFANDVEIRTGDMNDTVGADAGVAVERISGGDGNDTLQLPARDPVSAPSLIGGDGDDVLRDSDTNSALMDGGPGADDLSGGSGGDVLDGGTGSDRIVGGDGADTLANDGRLDGVTVDLAQGYATGPDGERDALARDIENVNGSPGPDVLTGDERLNLIDGGTGDDTINGAAGNDTLTGDLGADTLNGESGNDTLYGGRGYGDDPSPNSLSGGTGRDELNGGPRKDLLDGGPGGDWLRGLGGHDVYAARDGEFDWVSCGGRNRGQVLLDVHDFARACGRVLREGTARPIFVYGLLDARKYDVGLACPQDMPRPCEGTYRLTFTGGRTGRGRWRLKPGESPEGVYFESKLSVAERRAVARAPASSVALRLVTRDALGHRVMSTRPFPGPPISSWPNYAFGVDCDACAPDPPPGPTTATRAMVVSDW
jgi:Ca2+-binding RTX toxin-like protein